MELAEFLRGLIWNQDDGGRFHIVWIIGNAVLQIGNLKVVAILLWGAHITALKRQFSLIHSKHSSYYNAVKTGHIRNFEFYNGILCFYNFQKLYTKREGPLCMRTCLTLTTRKKGPCVALRTGERCMSCFQPSVWPQLLFQLKPQGPGHQLLSHASPAPL